MTVERKNIISLEKNVGCRNRIAIQNRRINASKAVITPPRMRAFVSGLLRFAPSSYSTVSMIIAPYLASGPYQG